jgi:membrane-associated protease RseP (regulator of RpoE activity)
VPVVADIQQTQGSSVTQPERPAVVPDQSLASRGPGRNVAPPPAGPEVSPPANTTPPAEEPGGGSLDFSFPTARRRLPRGLNPDRVLTNANIGSNSRQSAADVLKMLGISASCSARGCRVNSVSPNGVASNSGVRAGDVIEAVDGIALNGATTFSGQFSAAALRVRRNGAAMPIALRP